MIYRCCLVNNARIENQDNANAWIFGDELQVPATALLFMCKMIRNEASEVFFRENDFHFPTIAGIFRVRRMLQTEQFQWLNSLTLRMPLQSHVVLSESMATGPLTLPYLNASLARVDLATNLEVRLLFSMVATALRLKVLRFVIGPYWNPWNVEPAPSLTDLNLDIPKNQKPVNQTTTEKIWGQTGSGTAIADLKDLSDSKKDLRVTVIILCEPWNGP